MMPSLALYEYFSRNLARNMKHSIISKLVKIEALTKLNMFSEAIEALNSLCRGEYLPHYVAEKSKYIPNPAKYVNHLKNNLIKLISSFVNLNLNDLKTEFIWNSSKPIYDVNNIKVSI